jgi:FHA domain
VSAVADVDEVLKVNLGPERVIADAAASEERFLARYGDTQLLLVKLQPGLDALEMGLTTIQRTAVQRVQPSIRVMGFETAVLTEEQLLTLSFEDGEADHVRVDRLRWMLRNDRHFVMPLRKRTDDATFLDRVSVGRATNKDVVLRHSSVSKFHAWFEMDEHGSVYVADADSTNGTLLAGKKLPPRELIRVAPGEQVRFGSVDCICTDPAEFWRALRPA